MNQAQAQTMPSAQANVSRFLKYSVLLAGIGFLSACGGQAALKKDQAVHAVTAPNVVENTKAKRLWRASTASSSENPSDFMPIVSDKLIFTSSENGRIEGFSIDTGERQFQTKLDASLLVNVGVNTLSIVAATTGGEIIAIDRTQATEKWRIAVGRAISAAPAVTDQIVVIRTIDGHLMGVNATSGEAIWGLDRPVASLSVGLDSPSLIAGEGVITGFSSGRVLASNLYNGLPFWERRAVRPKGKNDIERLIDLDAPPVLAGAAVLVGAYQGGVIAYRVRDGGEIWRNAALATRKEIAVSPQALAVIAPQSEVVLVEAATGEMRWQQTQLRGHGLSGAVLMGGEVIVGSLDGVLYFLDIETGSIKSQMKLGIGAINALKEVGEDLLVYSARSGDLVSIKP